MKTLKKEIIIIIFAVCLMVSCGTETSTHIVVPPSDMPAWFIESHGWEWNDQRAYEQGRITFNEDSSMVIILGSRHVEGPNVLHEALVNKTYTIQ